MKNKYNNKKTKNKKKFRITDLTHSRMKCNIIKIILQASASADHHKDKGLISKFSQKTSYYRKLSRIFLFE